MEVKAVGLPCMNTTGNMVDGNLYSTKETIIKLNSYELVLSMTK